MLSSFRAVFFDAGGTLFHPYPSAGAIYHRFGLRYGCETSAQHLEKIFRETWQRRNMVGSSAGEKFEKDWWRSLVYEVFSHVGGVRHFNDFFEEVYDAFGSPDSWCLAPSAVEVLQGLRRRHYCLGIISNWDSRLIQLCRGLGLDQYFDFILTSTVFGASKPDARIFAEALRLAEVHPDQAVHVGDSFEDDVQGALNVGIRAIWLSSTPPDAGGVQRGAHRVPTILHLKELLS